jgi:carbonic anhydrase
MKTLGYLFERNREWAAARVAEDPAFFDRLCEIQRPHFLWIGCSDSRVPANEIVGLPPGEMFVQRNVANIVRHDDLNCTSVVQYAVDALQVRHIIVGGHYGCGGVKAVLDGSATGPVAEWLEPLRELRERHRGELDAIGDPDARWARLCELNVVEQLDRLRHSDIIRAAAERGAEVTLHGWIYDLRDGLLRDLDISVRI